MRKHSGWLVFSVALLIAAGCAQKQNVPDVAGGPPATMPAVDPMARLSLDQIEPKPVLERVAPSTQPSRPPLEAVELYARARDAALQNQQYTAINLIEQAIKLDPQSFELHAALGRAYQRIAGMADRAIAAFEQAEKTNPNDLDVQLELGRAYQSRNDADRAVRHFRLAMQTDEYRDGDVFAAAVDYRLAVALQQKGYDQAALECYQRLLDRLEQISFISRGAPELSFLLSRPQVIYEEMGRLHEKHGDYVQALSAYRELAEAAPTDFDSQARVVQMLVKLRRNPQAVDAAAAVVRAFRANSQSIELLRDVHEKTGTRGAFVDVLRRLHRDQPEERAILFALADTLASSGQFDQARQLLENGIQTHRGDVEVVQRLFKLYSDRDQVTDAARLLVRVSADYPAITTELEPLMFDLMRFSRKNSLRLVGLQKLDVPPSALVAKQYWIWLVASEPGWSRPPTARAALEQAGRANPPFDPAVRALLDSYLQRTDWDEPTRDRAVNALIESVQSRGRSDLAAELRGMAALSANRPDIAVAAFGEAIRLARPDVGPAPDLQLEYALAHVRAGNVPRFEQLMWNLLGQRPRFEAAYRLFIGYFKQNGADSQAWNLVNTWLTADPNNTNARIHQVAELVAQRRAEEAAELTRKLFEQRPDDDDVVSAMVRLLMAFDQLPEAVTLLEAERTKRPGNRVAVEALVEIYNAQDRRRDASRVIDDARAAVATDPDLLYYTAHLYQRVDEPQMTEQVLEEVLKLDPTHAQAGNDLGYTWADAGKNLDRAEAMIRLAVEAEPDNPAYIDSLAWVYYKKSRFEEAARLLQQATDPMDSADPIVLDHLGDAYYRLNRMNDARDIWNRSMQRLEQQAPRRDLIELRGQLQTKLRQSEAGQPVDVAPVAEAPAAANQARN